MKFGAVSHSSTFLVDCWPWPGAFLLAGLLISNSSQFADVINPWDLPITERILNRKHISHIILETRPGGYRITLLVNERFPYNYKSKSAPFFVRVRDAKAGLELAEKLDKYLDRGYSLRVHLNGSEIIEYELDESIK
ncbi:hypothetical protein [Leptospira fainei]|nr:hypothetical protein [Leptospira fainei]